MRSSATKITLIASAVGLFAANCTTTLAFGEAGLKLSPRQAAVVKSEITRQLRDPSSAKFGEIRAVEEGPDNLFVCGFVNAKNGYGGFTGMEPFAGILRGGFFTLAAIGNPYDVDPLCRKRGLPLQP